MNYRFPRLAFLLLLATPLLAQQPYRVHSHNDYLQDVPFWYAYGSGANSIEADVWLRGDSLYVAHDREEIAPGRTLDRLYLENLDRLAEDGTLRPVQLLIDLKSEAYATLDSVTAAIAHYPRLAHGGAVAFVISGNRPGPEDYPKYPEYISFDHQNLSDLTEIDLEKVALISQSFTPYSRWNGLGRMTKTDLARVDSVIQLARQTGKPFRFWATPDTKTAWAAFARLGVGYINSDDPAAARVFLDRLAQNTYPAMPAVETYVPENHFEPTAQPRNIILMIGDGNGLAQLSAARMANGGTLSITNIKTLGLVNTASADDKVTDSAAAGTALATGVKTRNRSIGVDTTGQPLQSLIELLSAADYHTGIITTDAIDGATPSAFYAHTDERDDSEKIIADLVASELSFFIAGGQSREAAITARFTPKTLDELADLDRPTAVFNGAGKMPSVQHDRGAFLPESVSKSLALLKAGEKPFFLLVEGAQIDNGGHADDIATIITEGLDFDQAVGRALQFADEDGETLVLITSDHETGGLGVTGGAAGGGVTADFLSGDHTGILVPLFAYGPGAGTFGGVFENTEVFHRILAALGMQAER